MLKKIMLDMGRDNGGNGLRFAEIIFSACDYKNEITTKYMIFSLSGV